MPAPCAAAGFLDADNIAWDVGSLLQQVLAARRMARGIKETKLGVPHRLHIGGDDLNWHRLKGRCYLHGALITGGSIGNRIRGGWCRDRVPVCGIREVGKCQHRSSIGKRGSGDSP